MSTQLSTFDRLLHERLPIFYGLHSHMNEELAYNLEVMHQVLICVHTELRRQF